MNIIDLTENQVEDIETRLEEYDENYITYKMDGYSEYFFLKRIG